MINTSSHPLGNNSKFREIALTPNASDLPRREIVPIWNEADTFQFYILIATTVFLLLSLGLAIFGIIRDIPSIQLNKWQRYIGSRIDADNDYLKKKVF